MKTESTLLSDIEFTIRVSIGIEIATTADVLPPEPTVRDLFAADVVKMVKFQNFGLAGFRQMCATLEEEGFSLPEHWQETRMKGMRSTR